MRRVLIGAYEDNILFLASAITFDALLAALPFVLLVLAALGYVAQAGRAPIEDIMRLLRELVPSPAITGEDPFQRAEGLIAGIIGSRQELSLYGFPLFIWFATRLFSSARNALNEVFDTEETRNYLVGKALDFSLVLVALTIVVVNTLFTLQAAHLPWFGKFLGGLSTLSFGVVLFFAVYTVSPARSVRWDTALVASVVAALGFEMTKRLYGLYLAEFATIDRLISNANAIAVLLFVVWMYFTACVFLIGGEVAETYDLMRRQREQRAVLA